MTITQLQYFVEVVKRKSITKAAKKLYVSQPAVSAAIKALEEEFKASFFIRYNNQITLTDEGHHLYQIALPLLENFNKTVEDMNAYINGTSILKVGIPPMLGTFLLSPILINYSKYQPNTTIQLIELGSAQNQQAILDGEIELGLTVIKGDQISDELSYYPILDTRLDLCVSKSHPLANKKEISLEELSNTPMVLMKDDCLQAAIIQKLFEEKGINPDIKIRTNQLYTIKELLLNNNLCAFMFSQVAEKDDDLISIKIKEDLSLRIVIAWKMNSPLKSVSSDFKAFLIKSF